MTTLTTAQVYSLARSVGLDPAKAVIATAIAMAESGLRTDARGDVGIQTSTWGPSVGLWQIRSLKAQSGTGGPRDATRLTDPTFNAQSMMSISGNGGSWKPWTTYTSGAYRKNIAAITPAASSVDTDPSWQQKLATALGSAVKDPIGTAANGASVVTGAVVDGTGLLPDWARQAVGVGVKLAAVAAGLGLLLLGANRLVAPAVTSALNSTTEAAA